MDHSACPVHHAPDNPQPLWQQMRLYGWLTCGTFTLVASGASFWLIWKHLTYYTCPQQQRHIVRLLFMPPIIAIVSLLSYVFYRDAIYYQTIRDCYEAVVITSFFYLLLQYIGDTTAEQHEVFRAIKLKKWFWPLGRWRYRPSGLHFLWLMKMWILQYAIIRPTCTIAAVVLQYHGLYCLESWAPKFGHVYLSIAISVSVTAAMYCLVQLYLPIQEELKPFRPVFKFLAVKSVVFLTFWQETFLSLLVYFDVIKEASHMTAADVQVGISALLCTFEMVILGFLHLKAFTYVIYRPADDTRKTVQWRALLDVFDYRDWFVEMKHSTRYIAARSQGRYFTLAEDIRREKYMHLEHAIGRDRWAQLKQEQTNAARALPTFWAHSDSPTSRGEKDMHQMMTGLGVDSFEIFHSRSADTPQKPFTENAPMLSGMPEAEYLYDPELVEPRRVGWVTAGPKSYVQSKSCALAGACVSAPVAPLMTAENESPSQHASVREDELDKCDLILAGAPADSLFLNELQRQDPPGNTTTQGGLHVAALPGTKRAHETHRPPHRDSPLASPPLHQYEGCMIASQQMQSPRCLESSPSATYKLALFSHIAPSQMRASHDIDAYAAARTRSGRYRIESRDFARASQGTPQSTCSTRGEIAAASPRGRGTLFTFNSTAVQNGDGELSLEFADKEKDSGSLL